VARDAGMLTAVDLQCLRTCLRAAQLVPSDKLVHVNLFPSTLLDTPVEELLELMAGIEAPICLELSEEQFVGDPRQLSARLGAIRSAGVRLAIDDLGKGRGTLDSVMLLEPDVVKIDKDLTLGANRDLRKERLLRRLVTLARALGVDVVAEGVETDGDLHLLRELEVDFAQGFYWAAPAPFAGG
ncbi:MAG: EAL domain-containing protein, partial [Myxococcales bacterium]|nr:EAL domain-containing protein [Myxococcales bacterium]